jgi:DNA-binding response OmpR family regulator
MPPRPRVLVVEDDDDSRELVIRLLQAWGFQGIAARNCKEAVRCISELPFIGVILDNGLPDGTGIDLLDFLRGSSEEPDAPVIFITGRPLAEKRSDVAISFLKPFDLDELEAAVRRLFVPRSGRT